MCLTVGWLAVCTSGCATQQQPAPDRPAEPTASPPAASDQVALLSERYWDVLAEQHPEWATQAGDHRFDDQLTQTGPEVQAAFAQRLELLLQDVKALQASLSDGALDVQEAITLDLLHHQLDEAVAFAALKTWTYDVDQMNGPQANLPYFFATYHPMKTLADVENAERRLRAMVTFVDQHIASLRLGLDARQTAPKVVTERVIAQLDRFAASTDATSSPFGPLLNRLPSDLGDDAKTQWTTRLSSVIVDEVMPAWERYRVFLQETYLAQARPTPGVSTMKGGAELYALLVRHHTTLPDLTPEQIHQRGLDALAQIEAEMGRIGADNGVDGGAQAYLAHLKADKANYATSREGLFSTFAGALARADEKLPEAFGRLPKLPYEVKPMDATREKDAPAAYYQPGSAEDGRPGVFVANLHRFEERPTFNSDVLAFHEAVPGHHLQFALAQELEGLPKFRREAYVTAYGEGWGLYSERLCDELGLYPTPATRMGYLGFAAWRAVRLVVDTGMHHMGWSRQQALDFMNAHTSLGKVDVENEVDRYIVIPGQALSYMTGMLHLLSLRDHVQKSLGDAYSLSAFHDAVLEVGSVPLPVLDAHVSRALKVPPHAPHAVSVVQKR